ncbi:MAG: formate dehydrogenase accessory protein FdhE [Chloroflexi bacterium]|nr:formate dehydrogenase accessory protein FdhE [Chloroflexota bacterium]
MSSESASLESLLDRRLSSLRNSRPELEPALDLQELLIRTTLGAVRPPQAEPLLVPRERAASYIRSGVPLLHDQPVTLDVHFAADLFSRLVNALQQREHAELGPRIQALVAAATGGLLDPQRLFAEAFVQHEEHLVELALQADVDAELLTTLAHWAVAPVLSAYSNQIMTIVDNLNDGTLRGAAWQRGYCPVCGAWPLLGELRGVELAEFLRCSGCAVAWRWQRLACPYCGNDDYRTLQTLQVEGERRFRINVCERCGGYLKVGNAFDPLPAALLSLDDIVSMHLDVVAIERGYQRPGGTGFAIELAVPEAEWLEELA